MKKKRKKSKLKRIFIEIYKSLLLFLKSTFAKFMLIPKKVRFIIYVWTVILLVICILIIGSSNNSSFLKKYKESENKISEAALDYVKTNEFYPIKENKLVLDIEFLKENNYLYKEDISDKTCRGISVVYYDDLKDDYIINSFINCKKYTTKGFNNYKK